VPPDTFGDATTDMEVVALATATVAVPHVRLLMVAAATVALPESVGEAHVASPRQNVVALALVPLFRFATGRLPVTSALKLTAPNVGAPAALPCSRVVVVPSEPSAVGVAPAPPPSSRAFAVSAPDDAIIPDAVKPKIPPLVPLESPVPPRATARVPEETLPAFSAVRPDPSPVKTFDALLSVSALP